MLVLCERACGLVQDAKAKEKAAKKAKAAAKAEAAKAAVLKEGDSKKAKAKKDAEEKKVWTLSASWHALQIGMPGMSLCQGVVTSNFCFNVQAAEAQAVQQMIEAARSTPKGQQKDYAAEMPKGYDPKFVEAAT